MPHEYHNCFKIEMPHEIDRRLLHIDGQVGSGQFGKVFKGTFSPIKDKETFTVAIKQIKGVTRVMLIIVTFMLKYLQTRSLLSCSMIF